MRDHDHLHADPQLKPSRPKCEELRNFGHVSVVSVIVHIQDRIINQFGLPVTGAALCQWHSPEARKAIRHTPHSDGNHPDTRDTDQ